MIILIQTILIFFIPYLIIKYKDFGLTKLIGTIGLAYLLGIVVSLIIFAINKTSVTFEFELNKDVGEIGSFVTISLAIPLLLFGANLKEVRKLSKTVLKSFLSLVISTVVVTTIVFYVYGTTIENGGVLSGMAIGLYTGGTPNLNAIGNIFNLDLTVIAAANFSDIVIGAIFYVFLLLGCKPILSKILNYKSEKYLLEESNIKNIDEVDVKRFKITKRLLIVVLLSFGMLISSALIGVVLWLVLPSDSTMFDILVPVLFIGVTVFGIVGSFNKKVRETDGMTVVGQYFILVFSFSLASSINYSELDNFFGPIFILYAVITVGVFIVHVVISKFMKIDADCTMVTLTAGLYGPAFVPAITNQIKNDSLTVPGLITGAVGYAIGTFLGTLLALLFMI